MLNVPASPKAVVVDDDPDICRYVSAILVEHGFETLTANDAHAGERLIRTLAPALVCLDLMMPGRTGLQLFLRLRADESLRRVRIIIITGIELALGVDWQTVEASFGKERPDGVVHKPIDPAALIRVVRDALARPCLDAP